MSDNGSSELQSPAGTDAQAMPLGMMMEFQQSLDMLSAVSPMSSPRSQNSLVPESTFLDERRDSGANIQETAKAGRKASMQNEVLNSIPPHLRGGFEAAGALVDWLDMRLLTYHEGFHMFEPDVHDQFSRLNFLTKAPSLVEDVPLSLLGELYEFLDANGDGVVSYDEWCTALDTVIHFRNVQSSGDGGIFAEVCPPLAGESLWIFDEFSPLRKRLAALLWNKWANITVVFSLLFIGCFRFVRHILGSEATTVTDSFEIFFGGLFTLEMLLRIVTLGFCLGRGSYLRSGWYKLDFVVVISFWLHMGLQLVDIQIPHLLSLRCLRLLLVLERIWIFDGIRVIMLALGEATGMLLYVTQAVWFVVLVFAILGTSAFGGTLQRQCLSSRGMPMQPPYSCKIFEDDRPPGFEDDPQSHNCPTGLFCVEGENPSYNQLSFDNLPQSLLALAQVLTLDDWAHQIMHPLRQGEPAWQAVMWIYFALLISLVSFVLLNLIVAVIITTFERWRRESQVSIFGQETRDTDMAVLQSQGRAKQHLFRHPSLYTSMARAKYKTLATAVMISPASALEALRQITNPMNVPSIPENNATSVFRKLSMTAGRVLHKGPSSDEQTDEDNLTRQARSSSVWLPRTQRGSVVHTGVRSQSVSGVASLSLKSDAPKTFQLPDATTIDIPPLPTGDVRDVGAAARQGSVRTTATVTTERSSEDPGSDVPAASGERPTVAASDYNSGLTRPDSFTLAHTITDSTGSTVAATLFDVLNSNKGDFEWPPGKATTDKDVRAAGEAALAGAEGKEGKEGRATPAASDREAASDAGSVEGNVSSLEDPDEASTVLSAMVSEGATSALTENVLFAHVHGHGHGEPAGHSHGGPSRHHDHGPAALDHRETYEHLHRVDGDGHFEGGGHAPGETCHLDRSKFAVWYRVQYSLLVAVHHPLFENFIMACIGCNMLLLCLEYHGMPKARLLMLRKTEYAFVAVYCLEFVLKAAAKGPRKYLSRQSDALDVMILLVTLLGFILEQVTPDFARINVVRAVRILRMTRFFRRIPKLWLLVLTALRSLPSLMNLLLFTIMGIATFAIVGVQMFKGSLTKGDHESFEDVFKGMLSLFRVMTGDAWTALMYKALIPDLNSRQHVLVEQMLGALYFIFFYAFSNFIVLNLLIAVILENFELSEEDQRRAQDMKAWDAVEQSDRRQLAFAFNHKETFGHQEPSDIEGLFSRRMSGMLMDHVQGFKKHQKRLKQIIEPPPSPSSGQAWFREIMETKLYRFLHGVLIVASSVQVALEQETEVLWDVVVTLGFALLFAVPLIGRVRNFWTYLDGFLLLSHVIISVSLLFHPIPRMAWKVFGLFRAMRPIQILNLHPEMRQSLTVLLGSVPSVMYVVLLYIILEFMFGIAGVQLFAGRLHKCNDLDAAGKFDCIGIFYKSPWPGAGFPMPKVWARPHHHFDDILASLLTLFRITSLHWLEVLHSVMDARGIDIQPRQTDDQFHFSALYFIIFIFIGRFFVLNLFVAVIVAYFTESGASRALTLEQKQYVETKRFLRSVQGETLTRPEDELRAKIFDFVTSKNFERFIVVCILVNTCVMATAHFGQSALWSSVLWWSNVAFSIIYIVELELRVAGRGISALRNKWTIFDVVVVFGAAIAIGFTGTFSVAPQAGRFFRVLHLVRLVKHSNNLRLLFDTLALSLGSITNIVVIILITFWVYAAVGVRVFGEVKRGWKLHFASNFETFPRAFLTNFQMISGDDWDIVMDDCRLVVPECSEFYDATGHWVSDCGSVIAPAFFVSFYVLVSFVLLNLFVALVIENFSYCYDRVPQLLTMTDLIQFQQVWQAFDVDNSGMLPVSVLSEFLQELEGPLVAPTRGLTPRALYHCIRTELLDRILARTKAQDQTRMHKWAANMVRKKKLWEAHRASVFSARSGASGSSRRSSVASRRSVPRRVSTVSNGSHRSVDAHGNRVQTPFADENALKAFLETCFTPQELLHTLLAWHLTLDYFLGAEQMQRRDTVMSVIQRVSVTLITSAWRGWHYRHTLPARVKRLLAATRRVQNQVLEAQTAKSPTSPFKSADNFPAPKGTWDSTSKEHSALPTPVASTAPPPRNKWAPKSASPGSSRPASAVSARKASPPPTVAAAPNPRQRLQNAIRTVASQASKPTLVNIAWQIAQQVKSGDPLGGLKSDVAGVRSRLARFGAPSMRSFKARQRTEQRRQAHGGTAVATVEEEAEAEAEAEAAAQAAAAAASAAAKRRRGWRKLKAIQILSNRVTPRPSLSPRVSPSASPRPSSPASSVASVASSASRRSSAISPGRPSPRSPSAVSRRASAMPSSSPIGRRSSLLGMVTSGAGGRRAVRHSISVRSLQA